MLLRNGLNYTFSRDSPGARTGYLLCYQPSHFPLRVDSGSTCSVQLRRWTVERVLLHRNVLIPSCALPSRKRKFNRMTLESRDQSKERFTLLGKRPAIIYWGLTLFSKRDRDTRTNITLGKLRKWWKFAPQAVQSYALFFVAFCFSILGYEWFWDQFLITAWIGSANLGVLLRSSDCYGK